MRLIVDISEQDYAALKVLCASGMGNTSDRRILNGIPLPKGHGDLIDRSELLTVTDYDGENERTYVLYEEIDNAHVIIEADKSESEA